jgi:hypothetical protein
MVWVPGESGSLRGVLMKRLRVLKVFDDTDRRRRRSGSSIPVV